MAKISIDLKSGTIDNNETVIGIDLGTTNSLIASVREDHSPFCVSKEGESIVPSAIHFKDDQILVGRAALEEMIAHPENTIYSVKRLMGKSYDDLLAHLNFFNYSLVDEGDDRLVKIKIAGKQYSPIELSSFVLKELKLVAEKQLACVVNKVVITVPAYFNDAQRQATRDAGKLAGMDVLRIINEPTAASLAYGIGLDQKEVKTVAVYDLGGGTFDVSILRIQNGIFEVLATHGDTFLGGDDFDHALVDYWVSEHDLQNLNSTDRQHLRITAEEAKKHLSSANHYSKTLVLQESSFELQMDRMQLNQLLKPLVERTLVSCESAVNDSQLNSEDIDEVVLVGGSVRVPLVRSMVAHFFEHAIINDGHNPDEVVALGAAIEADILAGNRRDILLLDVTPLSLGIETLGGLMDVIIPRNSKVPSKVKRSYTTSVDGQVNMTVSVYQGEREMVSDNRKLGEFQLKGIPAMPAGIPQIEVAFMLDADGILKVSAAELRSGVQQAVTLKPQYGLSDEEVERMLKDSIVHAQEDMDQRVLTESITDAEQLLYSMDKFLRDNSDLIPSDVQGQIKLRQERIQEAIHAKNRDDIVSSCDALNTYCKPLAEQVMDRSIAKALKGKHV